MYEPSSVEKIYKAWNNKTDIELQQINNKRVNTCQEKYGVSNPVFNKEVIAKIHETKKKNGSYGNSRIENSFALYLEKFGVVERQKVVNGWAIDFYINGIYIQLDGVYYHGLDRPLDKIAEFKTSLDKNIYLTYLRDRKQDQWFADNSMKLYRITDLEAIDYLEKSVISGRLGELFGKLQL